MSDRRKRVSLGRDPITGMVIWGSPEQLPPRLTKKPYKKHSEVAPGNRWCPECQAERPEAEFSPTATYCRHCLGVRGLMKSHGMSREQALVELETGKLKRVVAPGNQWCSGCQTEKSEAEFTGPKKYCRLCISTRAIAKRHGLTKAVQRYGMARTSRRLSMPARAAR
jgi:hypothetical protein